MSLNYASLLHVLSQPISLFNSSASRQASRRCSLHQPAALTSACRLGPRTHARATANFLEIKAADSLSGTGPPRQLYQRDLSYSSVITDKINGKWLPIL